VAADIDPRTWLADLVEERLRGHDPVTARLRLPRDLRASDPEGPDLEARARMMLARSLRRRPVEAEAPAEEALRSTMEGHLDLLTDLSLLLEEPPGAESLRAQLAAILAAAGGDLDAALKATPGPGGRPPTAAAVRRALARAGEAMLRIHYPPGDPEGGLPLYAGTVAIQRRLLGRVALDFFRNDELEPERVLPELEQAREEELLLLEATAGLVASDPLAGRPSRQVVHRQVLRLGLDRERSQAARAAAAAPREPEAIVADTPERLRPFLVEQMLLASLGMAAGSTPRAEYLARFAAASGISPERLAAMQVEAAAFHADHPDWFRAFGLPASPQWEPLAEQWNEFGDRIVDRVAAVVMENLDAIAVELRETGELGQLLAKAAAGQTLTSVEKAKVKEQLIDLAKAVPALAIFAAPGGMVLLPLLARLLPFDLLPSAFDPKRREARQGQKPRRPRS
jgi:hypothetical protein